MLEYGKHDNNRLGRNFLLPSPNKTPFKNNSISDERYSQYLSSRNNNTFDKVSRYSNNLFDDNGQRSHYSRSYNAYSPNKRYIIDGNNRSNEIADKMRLISSRSSSNIVRSGPSELIHNAHQSASSDSSLISSLDRSVEQTFQSLLSRSFSSPKTNCSMLSCGGRIQSIKRRGFEDGSLWEKEVCGSIPIKKTKGNESNYVIYEDLIEDKKRRNNKVPLLKNKLEGHELVGNVGAVDTSGLDEFSISSNCKGSLGLEDLNGSRCSSSSKINKDNCHNSVPLAQPKHIDVEHDSAFLKFDVFDYEHQNADVAKLPIVEPDLLLIGSPNKVVDVIENSQLLVQPKRIEVEKDEMFQKYDVFDYGHQDADINALPIIEPDLSIVDSLNKVRDKTDIPTLAQPKRVEVEYDDTHQKSNGFGYDHQNDDINPLPIIHSHTSLADSSNKVEDNIEVESLAQPKRVEVEYNDAHQMSNGFGYDHQNDDINPLPIVHSHISLADSSNNFDDNIEVESLAQPKCIEEENDNMLHEFHYSDHNTDNSALPMIHPHLSLTDSSNKVGIGAIAQSKHIEVEYDGIFDCSIQNIDINVSNIIDPHLSIVDSLNKTEENIDVGSLAQPKCIVREHDNMFQKFDVFDYGHQNADVDKLPIVYPDLSHQVIHQIEIDSIASDVVNTINNEELSNVNNDMVNQLKCASLVDTPLLSSFLSPKEKLIHLQDDIQTQLKFLANLVTNLGSISVDCTNNVMELNRKVSNIDTSRKNVDMLLPSNVVLSDENVIQLKNDLTVQIKSLTSKITDKSKKTDKGISNSQIKRPITKWKLILLDVPLRSAFRKNNIDRVKCHPNDPRLRPC